MNPRDNSNEVVAFCRDVLKKVKVKTTHRQYRHLRQYSQSSYVMGLTLKHEITKITD